MTSTRAQCIILLMKKKLTAVLICLVLALLATAACTLSPAGVLKSTMDNIAANATFDNGGSTSDKLSSCKGEGNGGFSLIFDEEKTFNRAFITLDAEAEITLSANGETLYSGKPGYMAFSSVTAKKLDVSVLCEGKWAASDCGVYNAPKAKNAPVVSVNAEDIATLSAQDLNDVSAVILRANVLYDTDGAVHFADVNGRDGGEYFSECVSALKSITSAPIYMQADVMYTDGKDEVANGAHLRYTALRTNGYATARNLTNTVNSYGLQGLHLDFSDSETEGTAFYCLGDFGRMWKSFSGKKLSATMLLEGAERSEKLEAFIAELFRDGGAAALDELILISGNGELSDAAKFVQSESKLPVMLAVDCDKDTSPYAFVCDCGKRAALINFNKAGANAIKTVK